MIFEVDGASQSTFLCLKYSLMKMHSVSLLFMGDTLGVFFYYFGAKRTLHLTVVSKTFEKKMTVCNFNYLKIINERTLLATKTLNM